MPSLVGGGPRRSGNLAQEVASQDSSASSEASSRRAGRGLGTEERSPVVWGFPDPGSQEQRTRPSWAGMPGPSLAHAVSGAPEMPGPQMAALEQQPPNTHTHQEGSSNHRRQGDSQKRKNTAGKVRQCGEQWLCPLTAELAGRRQGGFGTSSRILQAGWLGRGAHDHRPAGVAIGPAG